MKLSLLETSKTIEIKELYYDIETVKSKFIQLPIYKRVELMNKVAELFKLEPKKRGRPPTGFILRYKRLSISSKIKVSNFINTALLSECVQPSAKPKQVTTSKIIKIDFEKRVY
jgi:hypothetical protein